LNTFSNKVLPYEWHHEMTTRWIVSGVSQPNNSLDILGCNIPSVFSHILRLKTFYVLTTTICDKHRLLHVPLTHVYCHCDLTRAVSWTSNIWSQEFYRNWKVN